MATSKLTQEAIQNSKKSSHKKSADEFMLISQISPRGAIPFRNMNPINQLVSNQIKILGALELDGKPLTSPYKKYGPFRYQDGGTYFGEYVDSLREGQGVMSWPDGSCYEGMWLDDTMKGFGRKINSSAEVYIGEFQDGKENGKGEYTFEDNTVHTGVFEDGLLNGEGVEVNEDGSTFSGTFIKGKKEGKGHFEWGDGSSFRGNFRDDEIAGEGIFNVLTILGVYIWADSRVFDGKWANGEMNGSGIFMWPNGDVYQGSYKENKRDWFGKFFWYVSPLLIVRKDGRKYFGSWQKGEQHGEAQFITPEGKKRTGYWIEGILRHWVSDPEQE